MTPWYFHCQLERNEIPWVESSCLQYFLVVQEVSLNCGVDLLMKILQSLLSLLPLLGKKEYGEEPLFVMDEYLLQEVVDDVVMI